MAVPVWIWILVAAGTSVGTAFLWYAIWTMVDAGFGFLRLSVSLLFFLPMAIVDFVEWVWKGVPEFTAAYRKAKGEKPPKPPKPPAEPDPLDEHGIPYLR